jgi:hypothetical protein
VAVGLRQGGAAHINHSGGGGDFACGKNHCPHSHGAHQGFGWFHIICFVYLVKYLCLPGAPLQLKKLNLRGLYDDKQFCQYII